MARRPLAAGTGIQFSRREVTELRQRTPTCHRWRSSVLPVDDLTPSQKGAVAEAAITAMAIQLGLVVLRPLCEGRRYDLAIDLEPELLRVQCKLARRLSGVLLVGLATNRYTPGGYVSTSYTANEVDVIAAYSPELHRGFLIPISEAAGRRAIHLRLDPTENNQAQRINWARDYEFAPAIERLRSTPRMRRSEPGRIHFPS